MAKLANDGFDPKAFLAKVGVGKTILKLAKNKHVFEQGDVARSANRQMQKPWVAQWSDVLALTVTPCVDDADAGEVMASLASAELQSA